MLTFKQYLLEKKTPAGNYVALDCVDDLSNWIYIVTMVKPKTGKAPPAGDYHCTLMYSATTDLEPGKVLESLNSLDLNMVKINVVGVDCFDSVGEDNKEKSCLVLKLSGEILEKAHKTLSDYGLVHSYENFSPHVTLRYNMSVNEAHMYRDMIRSSGTKYGHVVLSNPRSETINKEYV